MDSWSFNSVVKAFPYDESFSTTDAFDKDQTGSMDCEVKPPIIVWNNMGLFPNEINIENQVFRDVGFPPLMKNSLFNPPTPPSHNAISQDNESDQIEAPLSNASKTAHNLSRSEVSTPPKRPRERGFGSPRPFCKVHGCNKNLSNCKEYHKRHKVCEVHSKTSRVIVNGIEQRFCQQCSRFHLLREFDDGKRSCRKRLAGHNERRRKPHAGVLFERHGRLLPYYNTRVEGKEFNASTRAISSFPVQDDLHNLYQQKYETRNRRQMNLDDRTAHDLQSISCVTDNQMHSKSLWPCNLKRNPRFDGYIGPTTSSSESARSLLSCQSQSTCNSSRIQTPNSQSNPVWFPGSHCEQTQDSRPFHQHDHDVNPLVGFEGSSSSSFAIHENFKGSKCRNVSEDLVFPDDGCTIDLVQLSSRLEILEHQKRSSEVNHAHKFHFCKEK